MKFPIQLTKKRIIWTIIILLIGGLISYNIVRPKDNSENILTDTVKKQDLKQTVLATGQVVSSTDLSLSFKVSGVVAKINVKEGEIVKSGQVLGYLEQKDQIAVLTQARGALAQAQANYKKVLEGASSEEIVVAQKAVDAAEVAVGNAQVSLDNTIKQQETAAKNAYSALLNSTLAAVASTANAGSATASISGTYMGVEQGQYKIKIYSDGYGKRFQILGLETFDGEVRLTPVPMGKQGLHISFSGTIYNNDEWTVTIPNTLASTYVVNYNAYQAALRTQSSNVDSAKATVKNAEVALDQAKASLALKRAQARPAEQDAAKAQILSAEGQVLAAQAALENAIIRAPLGGTITEVDIKPGELATALQPVMVLQDVGNLHIEANISEASIAYVREGQAVEATFDALGPDKIFIARVQTVNPASNVVSGVVNYKITALLEKIDNIRPGMTANLSILAGEKPGVLAVPQRAVLQNGKKVVRVVDDPKKKTFHEVEVKLGMEADGGLVEILSGLEEGQEVVTFIKK